MIGDKIFALINVTGVTPIPDGWTDILIIPATTVDIWDSVSPSEILTTTSPISFGTNRPNNNNFRSITIDGDAVVVLNGEASSS